MTSRPPSWKWTVCGLLLLASAINYMDRQTLANAGARITQEFGLNQKQYGWVESVFAYGFAAGSLLFGWLADRVSVRWLYAFVLTGWSLAGFATGFVRGHEELLWCRALLGVFEAGHWPCGVRTTRALLDARERSLGNGVLQSGTSIGAIITPLIMRAMMTAELGSWRLPFKLIGAVGLAWLILWFALVRKSDLPAPVSHAGAGSTESGIWRVIFSRRMLIVFVVIACINTTWQILRAWLPKIMQESRGYAEADTLYFTSVWYAATDIGCLGAGAVAVWLGRRFSVHAARVAVFAGCGAMCAACALTPLAAKGPALLAILLVAGAGSLGVFPIYHAFTQDISAKHQGKITGIAGVITWLATAQAQTAFGALADRSRALHGPAAQYDTGLVIASFLPLIAAVPLWLWWNSKSAPVDDQAKG